MSAAGDERSGRGDPIGNERARCARL